MRLTTMTDYALRMLIYLGQHRERLCTTSEIAQAYQISEAHLTKITHQLGRAGWITTVRGKGGGMRLAREPAQINLGGLVRSIEPDFHLVECLGSGNACTLAGHCRLTGIVHNALEAFLKQLDGHTLAELLPRGGPKAAAPPVPISLPAARRPRSTRSARPPEP